MSLKRIRQHLISAMTGVKQRISRYLVSPIGKALNSIGQRLSSPIVKRVQPIYQRCVQPITRTLERLHRHLEPLLRRGLQGLQNYLSPPVIEGSYEKTRIAVLVNTVLVVLVANAAVLMVLAPFIFPKPAYFILLFLIIAIMRHSAVFIMRRGYVLIASFILATVLWLGATFLVYISDGLNGPHILTYITVVLIAGLLVGGRIGIIFAILSMALSLGISYLNVHRLLPSTPLGVQTPLSIWFILAANLVVVAIFQYQALESLNRALKRANRLAQEATEANDYKSKLLARVSHELRSPLGAILGITEMLHYGALGETSPEQHDATQRVLNNTRYLQRLVADLLDQSRMEAGQITVEESEFSPAKIVQQVHSLLLSKAQEKKLTLEFDIDSNLPSTLIGDPDRTEQILFNLASNAIKFTEKGGIVIKAYLPNQDKSEWALQVTDTGIGIPPEDQKRIFEAFWQVDDSPARKYGGVGLGLAIVQQLVHLMKGHITLKSEVDHGSTFTVFLPLSEKP
ncbi:MAG: hypothetical protein JXB30_08505 [Anaerolineae bacterium]|nr:hypothetical protein [Anaerolineae bacterium]